MSMEKVWGEEEIINCSYRAILGVLVAHFGASVPDVHFSTPHPHPQNGPSKKTFVNKVSCFGKSPGAIEVSREEMS